MLARGASGWCPVTAAVDPHADNMDPTRRHLGGSRGIIVEDAITIYRPVSEVYSFWRNLENLPRFMEHLEEVQVLDRFHSHWVARGPLGMRVEWDAEVINDIPPTLLSWKSVGHSDVVSAGSVRFKAAGEHATQVRVKLQYDPPAGKLGATVAWLIGEEPQNQIAEDLRRFKQLLETGEVQRENIVRLRRARGFAAASTRPKNLVREVNGQEPGTRMRSDALRPGSLPRRPPAIRYEQLRRPAQGRLFVRATQAVAAG